MGKIWLETSDNRLIHLNVIGDDVNSPNDAVKIPTSLVLNQNRCYGEQVVVNVPDYGVVTIDLRPDGITGLCVQCGHCCTHLVADCPNTEGVCGWPYRADIDCHACSHLIVKNVNQWPKKNNTSCALYADILSFSKGCAYSLDVIDPKWVNCGYSF